MQSIQVKELLPEPNANDLNADSLVKFLEDYYDYMNLDGNPSREIAAIRQNKDIDYATEKYLDEIELLIAKYIPQSLLIDRERLLKIISNYYKLRGTEEGTKLFFKLFYGEDIDIYYPKDNVLGASDGEGKYVNFSLKTITLDDGTTLDIKKIIELNDNTDKRVYGQYEYNDDLKLYENIGKIVPIEYTTTKIGNTLRGSTTNTYLGNNTIISGNGSVLAIADRKGNVRTYKYTSLTSTWTQIGSTLTGQAATSRAISFVDASDTVTLNAHGLNNGDEISFTDVVNTTGVVAEQIYYVANKTTNNFKITHTPGATPITFSTSGTATANLIVYKKFGHAMAFDYTGTKLLVSEPGFSSGSYSGRVLLYEYNTATSSWALAKKGNNATDKTVDLVFYGNSSFGDDIAIFGHAIAFNKIGDSIAISSTNHTGGTNLDYVTTYKYKDNPLVWRSISFVDSTNKITLSSHGFENGDRVSFKDIVDTSGVVPEQIYFVINKTTNDFQIALKAGGTAIDFVTNGTGNLYSHKQSWQPHGIFPLKENELRSVAFTDAGDIVTLNNHGFNNGDEVIFNIIRDVDGVNAKQIYYVVNATTHTFKISTSAGGSALTFKNNGTGTLLPNNTGKGKILNLINGENFGWALAFNNTGTRLAIGTPGASLGKIGKCGKIDVYDYDNDFSQQWKLADNTSLYGTKFAGERYGYSLALSGDGNVVVGGAPYRAGTRTSSQINVGCVVSHIWKGQYWNAYGKMPLYGSYVESLFGYKVSLNDDGTRLALSAPGREISFGDADIDTYSYIHIYEFSTSRDMWIQTWDTLENKTYDLYQGYSLCFDSTGNKLIYGIPYDIDETKAIRSTTTFNRTATVNNKPSYTNGSQTISYDGTRWKWINGGSSQSANLGNEPYPWLATWPSGTTAIKSFNAAGSVHVYNINALNNSFSSDRTTRIGKVRKTIDGVQRDVWTVYDIFNESLVSGYRYSYITPPSGGVNFDYVYSTLEYIDIADSDNYKASTTEPVITAYYEAEQPTLSGTYYKIGNTVTITCANHNYTVGSQLYLNFSGALNASDGVFTVVAVSTALYENDTFIIVDTSTFENTPITGSVTFLAQTPTHPYEVQTWFPNTTVDFNYIDEVQVIATPDDIRWVASKRKGFLSDDYRLQDSYYWQTHSYEIKTQLQAIDWRDEYIGFCHPSGYELFSLLEVIDFAENDWIQHIQYIYGNFDYIPPRIRDLIKNPAKLPEGLVDVISGRGQHTPRSQYGRGIDRNIILLIFVKMLDDLGKTFTLRDDAGEIVYTRNMVRMLYVYLNIQVNSKYIRGKDADYLKFLGDDIDESDDVEYKSSGAARVYSYNSTSKTWIQRGQDLIGSTTDDYFGYCVATNDAGTRIAVSSPYNDYTTGNTAIDIGRVTVYDYNSTTQKWSQLGNPIIGEALNDYSGTSIAFNSVGDRLIIGAPSNGSGDTGHVRIYEYSNELWSQLGNDIDGTVAGDKSGTATSINSSGSRIAVGVPYFSGGGLIDNGSTRIYDYNVGTSTWTLVGSEILGEASYDHAGTSIALNDAGNRIIIGAPSNGNGDAGHVRIYEYISGTWTKLGNDIDGTVAGDKSGSAVSINSSGSRVAVGIPYSDFIGAPSNRVDRGLVRVYDYISGAWTQVGQDIDGELSDGNGGWSISMNASGSRVAFGAPNHVAGHSKVYEYNTIDSRWFQLGNDIYGSVYPYKNGYSVSLNASGDIIVVGESGSNGHVNISDGQSLCNGLLNLTPDEYFRLTTSQSMSKILNFPTNITQTLRSLYVSSSTPTNVVSEGGSLTFTINTIGVRDTTTLYYTTTSQADINNPTGSFVITSNSGSFTLQIKSDGITESSEKFAVAIRTGSITGPIIGYTHSITIQ
jgi:hypothetical protein